MRLRSRETLRALMFQAGLSHRRLAEKAGVRHHSTIDHLVSGSRCTVNASDAEAISAVLGVGATALFETGESSP